MRVRRNDQLDDAVDFWIAMDHDDAIHWSFGLGWGLVLLARGEHRSAGLLLARAIVSRHGSLALDIVSHATTLTADRSNVQVVDLIQRFQLRRPTSLEDENVSRPQILRNNSAKYPQLSSTIQTRTPMREPLRSIKSVRSAFLSQSAKHPQNVNHKIQRSQYVAYLLRFCCLSVSLILGPQIRAVEITQPQSFGRLVAASARVTSQKRAGLRDA